MDFIVVYDKKASGNPIVAIHSGRLEKDNIELHDIHPDDDPEERGVVMVPAEIISQMVTRKYRRDRKGNVVQKPVLREASKSLSSVLDTSLGGNIILFGEPVAELVGITDLAGQPVEGKVVNAEHGIIGVGERSGFFTVSCRVDTGVEAPVVTSEKENWRWKRDDDGNIVGMELITEQPAQEQAPSPSPAPAR